MNSSLSDIQLDIQRLAAQQNQMQTQQQQKLIAEQQRQILQLQQQQQFQTIQRQQSQPSPQPQFYPPPKYQPSELFFHCALMIFSTTLIVDVGYPAPLQSSVSAPHVPQALYSQQRVVEPQFFLHDNPPAPIATPPRRTWAQPVNDPYNIPQQPELRTWGKPQPVQIESNPGGFVLHHNADR